MFHEYKDKIEEGDTVIVYLSPNSMASIVVEGGKSYATRNGGFSHSAMIGMSYGSKMNATKGRGSIYLLHPTPELWTKVLPHRTQILYWPDISFISSWLDLTPGKVVVESGTGSGSFSHSIARAIAPTGRLYSYEYHKDRFEKAQLEFKQHKLEDVVVSKHRDVIADGFDVQDTADAVFLDLPAPWDVIAAAKKAMRRDSIGRICCFSPCIEQVQRTALALDRHGFTRICMYECLSRDYSVQRIPLPDISAVFDGGKVKFKQLESLQKNANKRRRLEGADGEAATGNGNGLVDVEASADEDAHYVLTSKCNAAESRGHTSYLTFAVLVPSQQDGAPEGTTAEAAVESASSEQSLKQA